MKFCYLDESGTGAEPYAVMVGIIVDAQRMHITKAHWQGLLQTLSRICGRAITEIHTRDFYPGSGVWRGLSGPKRSDIIDAVFRWLQARKHEIVFTVVDKEKFFAEYSQEKAACQVKTLWCFMALHIALAIQRHFQNVSKNKGNTLLIFDNEERERQSFTEIVWNPPDWTDSYYARHKKHGRLDQIIDVPYFVDSQQVGLIQVADFVSFFLRKHIELYQGKRVIDYADEAGKLKKWFEATMNLTIPRTHIFMKRNRCHCSELFYKYAPTGIREI